MWRFLLWASVVIVIGAVVVASYFYFINPRYSRIWQMHVFDAWASYQNVSDFRNATYLLSPWNGAGIYRHGTLDSSQYLDRNFIVSDIALRDEHTAMISTHAESGISEVLLNGVVLVSSKTYKAKVAISPDGTRILFAEAVDQDSSDWSVVIVDAAGTRTLGKGFGAVFLDDFTTLRFDAGIAVAEDLVTGQEVGSFETDIESSRFLVAQTKDYTLLAWRADVDKFVQVYRVVGLMPLTFEKVAFVEPVEGTLALTESALYVSSVPVYKEKTKIWKYSLSNQEGPEMIRILPSHLGVAEFIP